MPGQKVEVLAGSLGVWGLDQFASCLFPSSNSQGKTGQIPGPASEALSGEGDERTRGWPAFCVFDNPLTFSEGETSICVLEI